MTKTLVILLMLIGPATGFCQSGAKQVIKVPGISLQQLIRGFLDAGYSIEKSEASMSIIITHLKETKKATAATLLKAKIQNGNLLLSGEYIVPGKDENHVPITDGGVPGSPCRESWEAMHDFAQSFKKPLEIQ